MILANALMVVIMSFLVFAQISSAGSGMSLLRIVSSCMAHADETDAMPQLAETGRVGTPREHSITFDHVSFSYDQRPILRDVSFAIPDRTTTAIVGPSGSGKTTLCNLLARFWDVESGAVLVGGQNVKDYTLEGLMDQISMVFQKVYLFADTVENNIKFGCPNATHEEVVAAAKKACCHDFIPVSYTHLDVYKRQIHYHVRSEGQIVKKAVYIAIGVNLDGRKDVLGMWVGENESAKFWATILNGLKNRGVEDIFIACTDNLSGFDAAIHATFPQTEIQNCICLLYTSRCV